MATVTGLTKDRMLAIEAASIVDGEVDEAGHLILTRQDTTQFDAGLVKGAQGIPGNDAPPTAFIRDPTNGADVPSSFSVGLTIGTAGTGMPSSFATVETVYHNINRATQRVVDKETSRMVWRTAVSDVWTAWRYDKLEGSTSFRNTIYPTPTTDAERVALANQKIRWFNTDLGWEESYYAVTGTSGLTALGLVSTAPAGWYPTGLGPEITLEPSATHAASGGVTIGGWNGVTKRKGGSTWFAVANDLGVRIMFAGHYDLSWWTIQQTGSGTADYHTKLIDPSGAPVHWQSNVGGTPLSATLFTRSGGYYHDVLVRAGDNFRVICQSGSLNVHNVTTGTTDPPTRGQMCVRYIRPPLVSD